nr:ribonuclease H-like domain, reverse transcriptase, RNA-dependent DNA polymerase [Tanacetum cinerariifolium]
APNCPLRTRPNEQSNLVEEDMEPTLLMAMLEVEEQEVSLQEENVGYKETNMDSLDVKFKENETWDWKDSMIRGFRTLNDLYENTEELLLTEDEPKNYKEASSDQKWIEAMKVELDSINRNNTWELTTLPKGHKAISLKWVFKTKRDANGNIVKHKARLVAKCYIQEHGIDFEKVFAPVARMETIRLLLPIAANNKWEVHHLDVKSAFLHRDLKEEVYVTQPEGFIKRQDNGKVYRLIKALYRLRQAPRAWNIKLDNSLKSLDFKKCALEQAIYTKKTKDSILLIGVYAHGITYKHNGGNKIHGYSDSSYGVNTQEGKGTTGIIFYYGESPISWSTQKQATVALSSCESEFIAATAAAVADVVAPLKEKFIGLKYIQKLTKPATSYLAPPESEPCQWVYSLYQQDHLSSCKGYDVHST